MKNRFFVVSKVCLVILGMSLIHCTDDDTDTNNNNRNFGKDGVFVINEGNFQAGNASLTYYNLKEKDVNSDVYTDINGVALGDVGQSMYSDNDNLYIVVNNSQKIEVCDSKTMKRKLTINGLTSPRYFQPINASKAYVTDLFADAIHVVNPSTGMVDKKIALKGWSEEMIKIGSNVYITSPSSPYLYNVDSNTDQVLDSILISLGANSLRLAKDGSLWVLCGGDFVSGEKGALHVINLVQGKVQRSMSFTASDYPTKLCSNPQADTMYYINNGIYKLSTQAIALAQTPFISSEGRSFYGLEIHPTSGLICVTDAKDFTQRGDAYIYSVSGQLLHSFETGIIPGGILFERE
ncbi:MAG: hypothetical protein R2774_04450 [Saprospiraceae bacterium]